MTCTTKWLPKPRQLVWECRTNRNASKNQKMLSWAEVNYLMLGDWPTLLLHLKRTIIYPWEITARLHIPLFCEDPEQIISSTITNPISLFDLLNSNRHGFIKHWSCATQLWCNAPHSWSSTMDECCPLRITCNSFVVLAFWLRNSLTPLTACHWCPRPHTNATLQKLL